MEYYSAKKEQAIDTYYADKSQRHYVEQKAISKGYIHYNSIDMKNENGKNIGMENR